MTKKLFAQGAASGREGRGLHRDPQQLLQGRHQVARRGVPAHQARHLPGQRRAA